MKKLILLIALLGAPAFAEVVKVNAKINADNTKVNRRDAKAHALTPADQSRGSKADVELTRRIRELIVKDASLSFMVHNVKIVTLNGVATLRGPVESNIEREKVASLAGQVVSEAKLNNQIEVKAQQ